MGTYNAGLAYMKDGKIESFNKSDGLPDNQIQCLLQDSNSVVWVGTGSGLARYKNGVFRSITRKQGLHDHVVNGILLDDEDNFWISCNRGIYRVPRTSLNNVMDGREASVLGQSLRSCVPVYDCPLTTR